MRLTGQKLVKAVMDKECKAQQGVPALLECFNQVTTSYTNNNS